MQQEIDQLKSDVGDLRKNIGFDDELFDDLSDFDKKVRALRKSEQIRHEHSRLLSPRQEERCTEAGA